MSYIALYRKYRPKTFDEVYGQHAIVQTLTNQIKANRIAHAYLFCGPRGTGKTSIAKIFAKAINCSNPNNGSPCLQCKCCQETAQGLNVDIIEIDAASNNGVDNIRELIEESRYRPQHGKYKVYIIDEVHMLSNSAFNALLKTLEEPTGNTIFILATTEVHKVPPTIFSRCQRYNFKLLTNEEIVEALQDILTKENYTWDNNDTLFHIAKLAKGGLRDAFSMLDQCLNFINTSELTIDDVKEVFGELDLDSIEDMAKAINKSDVSTLLDIVKNQEVEGKSLSNICMGLYEYYKEEYFHNPNIDSEIYQRYMKVLAELSEKMKYNNNRTVFEIEMIHLCKPQMDTDYSGLYHRIQQLENIVEQLLAGNTNIPTQKLCINESEFTTFIIKPQNKIYTEMYYS